MFSVLSFVELEVTANQVRDKFKALLQSWFICESQGVAQSSSEPTVAATVSVAGENNNIIWKS